MRIIYSPSHQIHVPPDEIVNGKPLPHQEIPDRVKNILMALKQVGLKASQLSARIPDRLLKRVHNSDYLNFLKGTAQKLMPGEWIYPSVFNLRNGSLSNNELARHGYFSFDMYTPLSRCTYQSALDSASVAYQIAVEVRTNKVNVGYALCRPPGHHAEKDQMGGYCYLNNCAVAAEYLSQFGKVATLDLDFHHGNGTQHIFYERDDVLTVSIHADPNWKFPYFSGYRSEIGENKGEGYNYNIPLSKGADDDRYQKALRGALMHIYAYSPKYLVISLGLDTHVSDPIGGFGLTTDYYTEMAQTIAALNLSTVIVQEGGYNTKMLGKNVVAFLKGYN